MLLKEDPNIQIIGEAANGFELHKIIEENNFDLILLDLNLPGINGLDVLKQLIYENPKLKILVLSVYDEKKYAIRAIKAGACGYLNKNVSSEDLIEAIHQVAKGELFINKNTATILAHQLKEKKGNLHDILSDREFQIFLSLAQGYTIHDIADKYNLSPKSVSTYRSRIMEKMELKNNVEIALYAVKNSLIDP